MFEDALLESGGRIRTRRGRSSAMAATFNGGVVCLLIVLPLLHPASLPKRAMDILLAPPQPPASRPLSTIHTRNAATPETLVTNPFTLPRVILDLRASGDREFSSTALEDNPLSGNVGSLNGLPASIGAGAPPPAQVAPPPRKPSISSGVMEGRKLGGEMPHYPAIAWAAHVDGTVVLAATISKTGTIENLRVASGPALLTSAAVEAVRTWRLSTVPAERRTGRGGDDRECGLPAALRKLFAGQGKRPRRLE